MASRVKDNKEFLKYIKNKKYPDNGLGALLDGNGRIIDNNAVKAEMFNKYFSSVFVEKQMM